MEENKNEKFLDPETIIPQIGIKNGDTVADFGCGPGYFSFPFAKAVGPDGKIYALDVLEHIVEMVTNKAKEAGLANIEAKRANVEKENGSKIDSSSVDFVILKDVLFQNQKKEVIVSEAKRILKEAGKILVIEWNEKSVPIGPDKELRIVQDDLKKMISQTGFEIEKDIDAGNFHYGFVAVKK